ncbi:MAG TPA: DNA-processing protein DprA [Candidatus Saccharimonadales bacterium]|nr:DNA-processing protein DprA [Candidatus Saccharimonadales bacterium]
MLSVSVVPNKLRNIPDPPSQLFVKGYSVNELLERPCVAVVGSRKVSAYGKAVTAALAGDLARAGVLIISGLALGVDSIAHIAALDAGGLTLAVLPSPVEQIYPAAHEQLAKRIIAQGGALVSEYPAGAPVYRLNFVERNRIASGLCDALLITEAAEKSGTLHTANFALEQGKPVLAVPGNITSLTSVGTNNLIKTGATPVTSAADVLQALGIETGKAAKQPPKGDSPAEQALLDLLWGGVSDGAELLARSGLEPAPFNQALTMLEIHGQIRALGANRWALQ